MTTVYNLATGEERLYSLPPREAVRAAYAQANGDYNWWAYEKYDSLVTDAGRCVLCGNWSTQK